MNNPTNTTHSHEVPGKALRTEQLAIMNDLKELLTDTSKKNKKAFITCGDGRHDYHPVTECTIRAPLVGVNKKERTALISHFFAGGMIHYREKCANENCGKLRMASSNAAKGNV